MHRYYFGATRFSLFMPESGDWRLTRSRGAVDPKRYADELYSDERMSPRVSIFVSRLAPQLQEMSERHNYRHLVYYSPELPDKWANQLFEAAAAYPVLEPIQVDTLRIPTRHHISEIISSRGDTSEAMVFAFRIDDDDMVSRDYLDQIEPYLIPEHNGFAVTLASGYAGYYEDHEYVEFRQRMDPMVAIGIGAIGTWDPTLQKLDLDLISNHRMTPFRRSVLMDAKRPTFIHTWHAGQDSVLADAGAPEGQEGRVAEYKRRFERIRNVESLGTVAERFPTVLG